MSYIVYIFPFIAIVFVLLLAFWWLPIFKAEPKKENELPARFSFSADNHAMTGRDRLLVLVITLIYAAVAFLGLGDTSAPQNPCQFSERGRYVVFELPEETEISSVRYYAGLHTGDYTLEYSLDGENYEYVANLEQNYVALFKWKTAEYNEGVGTRAKYVRLIAGARLDMMELALYGPDGELLDASTFKTDTGAGPLFDEQELVPETASYMNSTYFDEIYHARTALEHLEDVKPYEVSHPPLGKIIIGIGIQLFGMTPFGWRFMGTLFGVLMLPVLYIFLKKLLGKTDIAACGTVIFAFDFMHFVQTRIATIDTYAVFFILLMYLFMWLYVSGGRLRYLALSGIFFGIGAASKWTCIYAGGGLAVIWLVHWISRRREEHYIRKLLLNILFCLVFFVAVPCAIYYVSYIPYGTANGMSGPSMLLSRDYFDIVWDNQKYMFSYHSKLVSEHPYSSRWYQWIVDGRPILYYLEYPGGDMRSSIGAFLSPLLCWSGLLAIISSAVLIFRKKSGKAAFIIIGYLAQLLPWVLISRLTFEYHYFPSAVFLTLALCLIFDEAQKVGLQHARRNMFIFTGASVALFALFYPVLSGLTVPNWYGTYFLKWLPSWPF